MAQVRLLVILQAVAGSLQRPTLLLVSSPFLALAASPAFLQVMLNAMYVSIWIG